MIYLIERLKEENDRLKRELWRDQMDELEKWGLAAEKTMQLEARIDALMLEYCPDEMTPEQIARWGAAQEPVGISKST